VNGVEIVHPVPARCAEFPKVVEVQVQQLNDPARRRAQPADDDRAAAVGWVRACA
jgi:hypothetical protein